MEFDEFMEEWHSATPYINARTSGSTGNPKLISLDKEFVRRSALRTNRFFNITEDSCLHSCVAADYIGGKMMAVRADLAGCRFTWERPSNRPLAGLRKEERIDLLAVVPSQMIHILDNIEDMPKIGAVIIGGSAINPQLYDRICESGLNAYETYGMTETASHIALRRIGSDLGNEGYRRRLGDFGEIASPCFGEIASPGLGENASPYFEEIASPGLVKISSQGWFETLEGITVEADERGCLVICFESGERFVTNDLAEVKDDRHFRIRGRYDHVIITGGKKVNPYDVEEKLAPYISVPFVVTSEPDYKWGRAVVLRIEGDSAEFSEDALRSVMRTILMPHEVPKKIEFVERLPRTENGKIKR